jgi:uncharacterized membrane protein
MVSSTVVLYRIIGGFQLAGVAVIVIGSVYTIIHLVIRLVRRTHGRFSIDFARLELGRSIALGLELFVAADIIRTIITPDYYQIGILSILVVIRTVLTYFLHQELATLHPS